MSHTPATIPILARVRDAQPAPTAWLCDIWGVLHNGVAAFPDAVAACRAFRQTGGYVLLVSNAPRPAAVVATQLAKLGVPDDAYDSILTSGDVTRDLIVPLLSRPLHHLGPERDRGIFYGLPVTFADIDSASAIVCTGLFDDTRETAADYRARFVTIADRSLPMVCANPDIHVERGGQIVDCAGAVAALYNSMGLEVRYAGKPYPEVYRIALERISAALKRAIEPSDVLAIGDGVNTDIKGASARGIPSVYIASAVHLKSPFSAEAVASLFSTTGFQPTAAMPALVW
jgi:HAD superfamily hydrolase (TIGR01459 family)